MMPPRKCVGCGAEFAFDPSRPNKKRCRPNCSRTRESHDGARARANALHELEFIGVDGEGVNCDEYVEVWDDQEDNLVIKRVKGHKYVLLSVGDRSLHAEGKQLHHQEIFEFLWEQYEAHPNGVFVGFFLGYDFTHWLRTIPELRAWRLLHKDGIASRMPRVPDARYPYPVVVGAWEFDILGMKRFKLRPYVKKADRPTRIVTHQDGTQEVKEISRPWMYINDTGAFFQTSFLNAINPAKWPTPILSPEEYAIIEEGKKERATAQFDADMIRYNVLENEILARLMTTLNEGFVEEGIKLGRQQWFGPGQAAQKWLSLAGCPPGELIREIVPDWARDAARESYFGGWFEIMMHGHVTGTTYGYDINSAYPYAISELPCLLHGQWTRGTGKPPRYVPGTLRLVNATVQGTNRHIGAMPHRRPDGTILRPRHTGGWYWWHEVQASKRAKLISKVEVESWIEYKPCDCPPPLAGIAELYAKRLQVNKNSPHGMAIKLIINSTYGKLAQSIGMPKFTNAIYASLITARCRTMILDAIATHPDGAHAVAMVATDSVTFLSPHPTIDIDPKRLGAWDDGEHQNLTLMMPGLYWDDSSRETIRAGAQIKVKSRGVPGKDLAKVVEKLDRQWDWFLRPQTERRDPPQVDIPITFGMITPKMAVIRDRWDLCGKVIFDGYRTISGTPVLKRPGWYRTDEDRRERPILRSNNYFEVPGEPRSTPYDKAFGEDLRANMDVQKETELLTPDGPLMQEIAHAIVPR